MQLDLEVLFSEAEAQSKAHVAAASLTSDEVACLIHACALASVADPEHDVQPACVDVIESRCVPNQSALVDFNESVQDGLTCQVAEAFATTGRFEVNRVALQLEHVHRCLGGCLTPAVGTGNCRCREVELAQAIVAARRKA